ncbi:MAG TPA: hypothetical protein VF008_29550 [Niastella sp.]
MTAEQKEAIKPLSRQIKKLIKSWNFEDEDKQASIIKKWLSNFEPEEIPIIYKLLPFLQIKRDVDTNEALDAISEHLSQRLGHDFNNIHFFPLADEAASSGSQFIYPLNKKFSHIGASFHDIYTDEYVCSAKAFVFVDDLVGSGHQANKFFTKHLKNLSIPCYYYSLYGYENGINYLRENSGFKMVFTPNIITEKDKIFSEQSKLQDKEQCKQIAQKYGERLYSKHPLGYEDSQAMICFINNCPNNTLPIIWAGYKNEMNEKMAWNPLFERRKVTADGKIKKANSIVRRRFENASDLVDYFYESVMGERYEDAFFCFAKVFRKEKYGHEDNIQYFRDGYNNTDSIKDKPLTLTIHESKHFARILVHYYETANVFKFKDLAEINKATLGDLKKLNEQLADFTAVLTESLGAHPEHIENIPLYLFFSQNSVEDVGWTCGISYEAMSKQFKSNVKPIARVKYFDCKYSIDHGWEIKRISPVFTSGEPFN